MTRSSSKWTGYTIAVKLTTNGEPLFSMVFPCFFHVVCGWWPCSSSCSALAPPASEEAPNLRCAKLFVNGLCKPAPMTPMIIPVSWYVLIPPGCSSGLVLVHGFQTFKFVRLPMASVCILTVPVFPTSLGSLWSLWLPWSLWSPCSLCASQTSFNQYV